MTNEGHSKISRVNVPNRYSHVLKCTCWRPVTHAQTWPVIVHCTVSVVFPYQGLYHLTTCC